MQDYSSQAPPTVHLTKTEVALAYLRSQIQSGVFAPDERLQVDALARTLGMSVTPIREALRLLQADRLVTFHPHRGVVVAQTSQETTLEVQKLRCLLEPLATQEAVPRLSSGDMEQLRALQARMRTAIEQNRISELSDLNREWHWQIYSQSESPLLLDFVRQLWDVFPWRTVWTLPGYAETSIREHEELLEAIQARDAAKAADLMEAHIVRDLSRRNVKRPALSDD